MALITIGNEQWFDLGTFNEPTASQICAIFNIPTKEPMNAPESNATTPAAGPAPVADPITNTLIHDLVLTGLTAASIFIKNPQSQQTAGSLINLVNAILKEHTGQAL